MTLAQYYELSCDHPGCDVAFAPSADELVSVKLTRVGSTIVGWTQVGGKDYCPTHMSAYDRVEQIRELVAKRLTDGEIADRLGISRDRVQRVRSAAGIAPGQGRVGRPSSRSAAA